jgi:aerobic-type carbon monoxide dehydrogenase small subunit (CoxS/CutS family)
MARVTELEVNGQRRKIDADAKTSLLSVLRDQLSLTGSKFGCGEAECGACTVLLNGQPQRSCIMPVSFAAGKQITTIESFEKDGQLHPLQQAFLDEQAFQCGYCTSGMIVTASALLRDHPNPTDEEIIRYMDGNMCRCGTHYRIIAAIHKASRLMAS